MGPDRPVEHAQGCLLAFGLALLLWALIFGVIFAVLYG